MNVALAVTGCIAAYKAVDVMRGLQKAGVSVQVVLTRAAARFVAPLTFEALSGRRVITDMFRGGENVQIQHIAVAQQVGSLAVVPATANILAKFAHGIADDFLSTLYISTPAPVLLAPAMNVEMWNHPAVQANVEILRSRGHEFVNPEPGVLACGMEGEGRLAEVETIVSRILNLVANSESLAGLKVLVTAGPTVEDIDPVRYLSNRSTGKMGYALAQAARARGAEPGAGHGPGPPDRPPDRHHARRPGVGVERARWRRGLRGGAADLGRRGGPGGTVPELHLRFRGRQPPSHDVVRDGHPHVRARSAVGGRRRRQQDW